MGIGDIIVELFVQKASNFLKPLDETTNLIDSMLGIMWVQFVNLGFILIFISINIPIFSEMEGAVIFNG
jgi:hypothetical protein